MKSENWNEKFLKDEGNVYIHINFLKDAIAFLMYL